MNVHRWCVSVGAAFIFMLFAVGAVYGQQAVTISPPNPVANQPITFNVTDPTTATNYVYITIANRSQNCKNFTSLSLYASGYTLGPFTSDSEGNFYVTLTKGLPAGAYCVMVAAQVGGSSYYTRPELFTVGSSAPVPEFSGTLIVFSLSLAALYCTLEGRRRRLRNLRP
jgi:hypothetical protein